MWQGHPNSCARPPRRRRWETHITGGVAVARPPHAGSGQGTPARWPQLQCARDDHGEHVRIDSRDVGGVCRAETSTLQVNDATYLVLCPRRWEGGACLGAQDVWNPS